MQRSSIITSKTVSAHCLKYTHVHIYAWAQAVQIKKITILLMRRVKRYFFNNLPKVLMFYTSDLVRLHLEKSKALFNGIQKLNGGLEISNVIQHF